MVDGGGDGGAGCGAGCGDLTRVRLPLRLLGACREGAGVLLRLRSRVTRGVEGAVGARLVWLDRGTRYAGRLRTVGEALQTRR